MRKKKLKNILEINSEDVEGAPSFTDISDMPSFPRSPSVRRILATLSKKDRGTNPIEEFKKRVRERSKKTDLSLEDIVELVHRYRGLEE